ncbi:hypothetical protein HK101_007245 [Irineochytrium annulatum]|nr:hypothetical protein HK101_007245 [Irineochytrium annulatum]
MGNVNYVTRLEISFTFASFGRYDKHNKRDPSDNHDAYGRRLPIHFYGQLPKTDYGYQRLWQSGHVKVFAESIKAAGVDCEADTELLKLKSDLWAIAHIGSTNLGLQLLLQEDIISYIVKLAEQCKSFSLKGDFIKLKRSLDDRVDPSRFDAISEEILKFIGNMSNHILANAASKSLSRMRHENPYYFTDVYLYLEVLRMLGIFHYRITARRFIQELFDKLVFSEQSISIIDKIRNLA